MHGTKKSVSKEEKLHMYENTVFFGDFAEFPEKKE